MLLLVGQGSGWAQNNYAEEDSLYIEEMEYNTEPYKVLHAEPLYIDLIRDLGARKGEREWNLGLGIADNLEFDSYEALIEYEWAAANRLGLEVELPFTFFSPMEGIPRDSIPSNQLDALQVAMQWTFYVNVEQAVSMALGYLNEFELSDFNDFGNPLFKGNTYNPFLVVAKRWGGHFHSLVYTGPLIEQDYRTGEVEVPFEMNTSFHYMVPGTDNFIGVEFNKAWEHGDFDMTIRPQMRLDISQNFLIGVVTGIPISRESERFSGFIRVIYEPLFDNNKIPY
ncbi:MAG: phosphoribosylformylglycinamidine synthase [Flavobacteriaceae bacterium]|nr:MAG: phosphoribosylformylglycinamidine synthase [Flavobacteriaceae bacterium]